jgi:hypothetical protein
MIRPDDVQPLNDREQDIYRTVEKLLDEVLRKERGHVAVAVDDKLWRIANKAAQSYSDCGWVVVLQQVYHGWLLKVTHPAISMPDNLMSHATTLQWADNETPWVNSEGEIRKAAEAVAQS